MSDLEGLVDDPASLVLSHNNAITSPQISSQGLDILSASQYPHAFSEQYRPATRGSSKRKVTTKAQPEQFYGGIVYNDTRLGSSGEASNDDSIEQEQSPEPARPRKRAKKNASVKIQAETGNDENSKKQRGRPRLDTQDETAADRRRTQIRLAQRAYRNRKESTISGLKGKVHSLQSTIEQMNAAFVDLHDNLLDSGLVNGRRTLIEQLEKMTADFEAFSQEAALEDDEDLEDGPKITEKEKPRGGKAAQKKNTLVSPSQKSQESDVEELSATQFSTTSDLYGYDDAWGDQNSGDVMQFNVHVPEAQVSLEDVVSETKTQLKIASKVERPLPITSVAGFYTYSFQETTFARRLHRLCLERAFRNLTNPSIEPAYIKHVFRFTFCFSNRRRMLARFQDMLKRKAGEALENYNVPFFHIGGAGTHFPRTDKNGNKIFPPNMATPAAAITAPGFGPLREPWTIVETPRSESTTEEMLEKLGFGGLWFDSHDVDEYLKTKGIVLDGTSSFVEVDPANLTLNTTLPASSPTQGNNSPNPFSNWSSATPSTHGSSPVRTPSPENQYLGPVSIDYVPDHYYSAQPPAQFKQAPSDSFYASFASATDAVQPYFTGLEKEFRSQDPWAQVQSVQARQIWPWADTMPNPDVLPELSWSVDPTINAAGLDMPLFADVTNSNASGPQQHQYRLLNDGSVSAQPDLSNAASMLRALQRRGQPVTIDVEKFLERMVDGAACLGRAPGFRKEMVDNAVVMSLAEAF